MLNHLDDPEPHAFPDDFRAHVDARARKLRARRRIGLAGAATVAVIALAAAGLYGRALTRIDDVERVTVAGTGDPAEGHRTVLLTGVDDANGGPTRTDTMLVVRFEGGRASVLSVPRDLAVTAPDGAEMRANTVAAELGYAGLLDVLASNFGIDVDNVVEVDFAGFSQLVDLVGGIDVQTAAPVRDEMTGLAIETAGCHRLDGDQTLALARARRLQHFADGRWRTDPTGDLGRIARQPALLMASLDALTRTRPDPLTADRLAGWLADHATVDDTLGNQELIALLTAVMDLDPTEVRFTTLPVEAHTLDGGAAVLRATADAEQTIEGWRNGHTTTTAGDDDLISPCRDDAAPRARPLDGAPAPNLVGRSILGGDFDLRSHRGRHVVVAFTASWCPPCIDDLHELVEFAARRPDVTVVSVAVSDDPEAIARLFRDLDADWPLLDDADGRIAQRYGLTGVPAAVIVEPDGTIGGTITGTSTPGLLDERIA